MRYKNKMDVLYDAVYETFECSTTANQQASFSRLLFKIFYYKKQ